MLQAYAIENLRPGMMVGRDVIELDGGVLLRKGQKLTKENICSLLDRPIFCIYIEEATEVVEIPGKEHLRDSDYVSCYERAHEQVKRLMLGISQDGRLDRGLLDFFLR